MPIPTLESVRSTVGVIILTYTMIYKTVVIYMSVLKGIRTKNTLLFYRFCEWLKE